MSLTLMYLMTDHKSSFSLTIRKKNFPNFEKNIFKTTSTFICVFMYG